MISEPVDKRTQEKYVKAEQDLFWLADHDRLDYAADWLANARTQREMIIAAGERYRKDL